MDFRSRGVQSSTPTGSAPVSGMSAATSNNKKVLFATWMERSSVILLFAIAIIILAIAALTFFGGNSESHLVKKGKYQAVFLNNGQVYFGNIQDLNNKFINLDNIYYLQTNSSNSSTTSSSSNSNVSLVKLGCELHAPFDQMVINRDQVLFWENLQDGGQVVKAIKQYQQNNPKGQTCSTSSQNSTQQASPTTSTQSSTSPASPSAPTTSPTKKP